jgi:lipid-A-disaccharide synthase
MNVTPIKLFFIAGEASGDLHGGNLIREIKQLDNSIEIQCWGGDKMTAAGGKLLKHIRELSFMGFVEVLLNLKTILRNFKSCKTQIAEFKPDALVLIDFPGFNLRMAEWAKKQGIPVFYYISPQIWAWKQSRIHKIKACVDKMYVILPFEKEFYAKFNYPVEYVGSPLLDAIEQHIEQSVNRGTLRERYQLDNRPILALVPGSRKQEIKRKLPLMLKAAESFPSHQVIVTGAPAIDPSYYDQFVHPQQHVIFNETYDIIQSAEIAAVTSGTATLETALIGTPQVVCYKGSFLSYFIARMLIKVRFISLVNLIMDREIIKELIQQECTASHLQKELSILLTDKLRCNQLVKEYGELKAILGKGGASKKVAQSLLKTIREV